MFNFAPDFARKHKFIEKFYISFTVLIILKMKKLVLFVAVIAALSLASCKQKAAPEAPVVPDTEAVAPAVEEGVAEDGAAEAAPAEGEVAPAE